MLGQHAEQGRPARGGDTRLPSSPRARPRAPGCGVQPGAGLQEDGPPGRGPGRLRARAAARPAGRETAVAARRHRDAARASSRRRRRRSRRAWRRKVDRPSFLLKLGECYIEMKRWDEAEKQLREALRLAPDSSRGALQPRASSTRRAARSARSHRRVRGGAGPGHQGLPIRIQPRRGSCSGRAGAPEAVARFRAGPAGEARVRHRLAVPRQGAARHGRPERRRGGRAEGPRPMPRADSGAARPLRAGRRLHAAGADRRSRAPGQGRPAAGAGRVRLLFALAPGRRERAGPPESRGVRAPTGNEGADRGPAPRSRHHRHAARRPPRMLRQHDRGHAEPRPPGPAKARSRAHATVHVPLTRPSHVSIFTGLYPAEHGIRDNVSPPLAPERAAARRDPPAARASHTAGFVSVDRALDANPGSAAASTPTRTVRDRRGRRAVPEHDPEARRRRRPRRRSPGSSRAATDGTSSGCTSTTRTIRTSRRSPTRRATRAGPTTARSPGPTSSWAGSTRRSTRLGRRDDTLLVVTSDHGEGLDEHGESVHGFFVYESTLRVPLLVRGPGIRPGTRVPVVATGAST